jgi:hypothetical protein
MVATVFCVILNYRHVCVDILDPAAEQRGGSLMCGQVRHLQFILLLHLKGTVSRDFRPSVFFIKTSVLGS